MSNIPNQFRVVTKKKAMYPSGTLFSMFDIEADEYALKNLTYSEYKLYRYFSRNQPGYSFDLYPEQVLKHFDLSKSSYDKALRALKEKGYLVYTGQKGCNYLYNFYEWPNNHRPENEQLVYNNDDDIAIAKAAYSKK